MFSLQCSIPISLKNVSSKNPIKFQKKTYETAFYSAIALTSYYYRLTRTENRLPKQLEFGVFLNKETLSSNKGNFTTPLHLPQRCKITTWREINIAMYPHFINY